MRKYKAKQHKLPFEIFLVGVLTIEFMKTYLDEQ